MDSATSLRYAQNDGRGPVVIPREVAESSAFASPHSSFPRRRESSKNSDIEFSHEGDDITPFYVGVKILDSRLRGNDGVGTLLR